MRIVDMYSYPVFEPYFLIGDVPINWMELREWLDDVIGIGNWAFTNKVLRFKTAEDKMLYVLKWGNTT